MSSESYEEMRARHEKELDYQIDINRKRLQSLTDRHRSELVEVVMRSQPADFVQELCRMMRQPMLDIMKIEAPSSAEYYDAQHVINNIDHIERVFTK